MITAMDIIYKSKDPCQINLKYFHPEALLCNMRIK